MKTVKFRIWDKKYQNWEDLDEFALDVSGRLVQVKNIENPDQYVIQQYTGLKDENEKEIYEGDILKLYYQCMSGYTYGLVKYHQETTSFRLLNVRSIKGGEPEFFNCNDIWANPLCWEYAEVIGNLYENPSLIHNDKRN